MDTVSPGTDSIETRTKQAELDLKTVELEIKRNELKSKIGFLGSLKITAIEATIIVGFLGFVGSFLATYLQQREQFIAKKNEFTSQLILSAMKAADSNTAITRLKFLIEAGYLNDEGSRIANLILSGKYGSAITTPSSPKLLDAVVHGDAPAILREIVAITGQVPDIDLRVDDNFVVIAALMSEGGRYTLHYDRKTIQGLASDGRSNWLAVAILAHEIGHAVLGHLSGRLCFAPPSPTPSPSPAGLPCIRDTKTAELEADRYAGFILRRLGASLEDAKGAFAFLPIEGGETHPARADRIEMLAKGWNDMECPCSVSSLKRQ